MKHRLERAGVVFAAVVALLAITTPSATATTVKTITYLGTAVVPGGLGFPCTPPGTLQCTTVSTTTKPGPKGEPVVNITPNGNHRNFRFSSISCIKSSATTFDKPTPKAGVLDACQIHAEGVVWGFCGFSTGAGVMALVNLSSIKSTISIFFKFTDVGGIVSITGSAENGRRQIYGSGMIVGDPSGWGSCFTKTGEQFIWAGEIVYIEKTLL